MTFSDAYNKAAVAVHAHPGYVEHEKIQALQRMVGGVVHPNLVELAGLLEQLGHDPELASIAASNTPQLHAAREEIDSLVARRLHNFVGSASSLVDHVRVMLAGRDTPAVAALKAGVAALITDGAWPFVKDLRNLVHHVRVPFVGHHVAFSRNADGVVELQGGGARLFKNDLASFDGWKADAKRFLASCGDDIPLLPVIRQAGDGIVQLHVALIRDLARENAAALAEVNDLVIKAHALRFGGDEQKARAFMDAMHRPQAAPPTD